MVWASSWFQWVAKDKNHWSGSGVALDKTIQYGKFIMGAPCFPISAFSLCLQDPLLYLILLKPAFKGFPNRE